MDQSADALLALSNTAAAIAEAGNEAAGEDDRSSSLSELEDAPDNVDLGDDEDEDEEEEQEDEDDVDDAEQQAAHAIPDPPLPDGESEAETERLEESPDKQKKTFPISPSKLAQSITATDDVRPEIEELTNSEPSSPMTPVDDSPLDDLSDAEDVVAGANPLDVLSQAVAVTNKRKRLSDVMDIASEERPRKRRTESLSEPDEDDEVESEAESETEKPDEATREATIEAEDGEAAEDDEKGPVDEIEDDKAESSDESKSKKAEQYTRARSRRGKEAAEEAQEDDDEEEENEAEASDEEAEADDVDAVVKSEEEQAKRAAAMDALTSLEHHFASLRDKLYDEKISQINQELVQLSADVSDHPELLKQFECVNQYRDEKQATEQQLLVFKVGALKRKSVAERSQLHSAYFQTVRDIRERHMEHMSEHFYRIQRERFKSTQVTPTYTVPFPAKKITQVTQQTAYNKEVSILSGVAKYVGFPAAPPLNETPDSELNSDLQKMGIHSSSTRIRNSAQARHAARHTPYPATHATSALSSSAAAASASSEQQFIESTPWANPNHPIHRLGRAKAKSPLAEPHASAATPATQPHGHGTESTPAPIGSASTIVENPTPSQGDASSAIKPEAQPRGTAAAVNGLAGGEAISPSETRRTISNMLQAGATAAAAQRSQSATPNLVGGEGREKEAVYLGVNSSPLQARASLLSSLNRTASATGMRENTKSPFRADLVAGGSGGMGRFGFR